MALCGKFAYYNTNDFVATYYCGGMRPRFFDLKKLVQKTWCSNIDENKYKEYFSKYLGQKRFF